MQTRRLECVGFRGSPQLGAEHRWSRSKRTGKDGELGRAGGCADLGGVYHGNIIINHNTQCMVGGHMSHQCKLPRYLHTLSDLKTPVISYIQAAP